METQTKKLKVYCETSFWSWLASDPATAPAKAIMQAYTHKWWKEVAPLCDIFVSQHVFDEAQRGDARLAERRYRLYSGQKQLDGYFDDVVSLAGYDCPAIMTPHQFLEHREEFEI